MDNSVVKSVTPVTHETLTALIAHFTDNETKKKVGDKCRHCGRTACTCCSVSDTQDNKES